MEIKQVRCSLRDIIEGLRIVPMNEERMDEIIASLCEYMNQYQRYDYNEVTTYVIKKIGSEREEETIPVILDNICLLLGYIETKCKCSEDIATPRECKELDAEVIKCKRKRKNVLMSLDCKEAKRLYRFIVKLKDHISLENTRFSEIQNQNKQINEQLAQVKKVEEHAQSMQDKLSEKMDYVNNETKNIYIQMVSILGIFTAIVITVFGGFDVIAGIIDALTSADLKQRVNVLFAATLTIFFVVNIIYILLDLIGRLRNDYKPSKDVRRIVIFVDIICVCSGFYCLGIFGDLSRWIVELINAAKEANPN